MGNHVEEAHRYRSWSRIFPRFSGVYAPKVRVVLVKGGKPVAELGPTNAAAPVRLGELPAVLEALPHLEPEDAERFAIDLEAGRTAAGRIPTVP